jgi:hypothetical protein
MASGLNPVLNYCTPGAPSEMNPTDGGLNPVVKYYTPDTPRSNGLVEDSQYLLNAWASLEYCFDCC